MAKILNFPMYTWCKDLFPLCRSITGKGIKDTLSYFEKINPSLKRIKFKTGEKVLDWSIPYEWHIKDAFIQNIKTKKKFAEFKKNNLHVVNFSEPVKKIISKQDLLKKIFNHNANKFFIPYVTSYYKKFLCFCMSEKEKNKLPEGKYKVFVDSKFTKGTLELSHSLIRGKSRKEIFFSSYVCHPSMANNELSGPVILSAILKYITSNYKKTNFSYRFVLLPETIGSISYLSKFKKIMKKNIFIGFNLSCLGDSKAYSIIKSPNKDCLSYKILYSLLKKKKNLIVYDFLERGSDERQYCAPNIELPVVGYCRSKYGKYKEYHTSADNLNLISQKSLEDSLEVLIDLVEGCETCLYPRTTTFGEPNLSKRKLYPTLSKEDTLDDKLRLRKNLLAYSNGKKTIFEISEILGENIKNVIKEYKILIKNNLIKNEKI